MNPLFEKLFVPHIKNDNPFLILEDGIELEYKAFMQRVFHFSYKIRNLGLEPGDRLAVQIKKSVDSLVIYAACVQTGVVFLPLNPDYKKDEVTFFLNDSCAKLFICSVSMESKLVEFKKKNTLIRTLELNGAGSFLSSSVPFLQDDKVASRKSSDMAAFLYTSGTTGRSKAVILTQDNLISNAVTLEKAWKFNAKDILLHALPVYHTHGLFVAINITLLSGSKIIYLPRFEAKKMLEWLPKSTIMMGVPTYYARLIELLALRKINIEKIRLLVSGSAPLLPETSNRFFELTGIRILERYGMTETNMNISNPYDGKRKVGSVGLPLSNIDVRIINEAEGRVKNNEVGEIQVRGRNVFSGYWGLPEKTKESFTADGFFKTGDLAIEDSDGYISIVGRLSDLIISGGFNIYPKEIEAVLNENEKIEETAVIGLPNNDLGEVVFGVIVLKENCEMDLNELYKQMDKKLARYKHPRDYRFVEELPRNAMGKVQKNLLKLKFQNFFETDTDLLRSNSLKFEEKNEL